MNRVDPNAADVKPLPLPDPDSALYWKGLKEGRLLLQHCLDCGNNQVYHQAICRKCVGSRLEHRTASGYATVYSLSVVYRAPGPAFRDDTPYAVLLVELDEGPRMISSLTGAKPEAVAIGMRVQLVCEPVSDSISLPRFRPVEAACSGSFP